MRYRNSKGCWCLSDVGREGRHVQHHQVERPLEQLAYAYFVAKDAENYIVNVERAVELNPNNAHLLGIAGWGLMLAGVWERGDLSPKSTLI